PHSRGFRSRSRAGLRLHPGVRHGAMRRRWCEWEQPHTLSWRSATADDAEWMSGKSRARLAFGLDRGFLMDVGPTQVARITLVTSVEKTEARSRPMSQSAFGRSASAARRARDRSRSGSVSHSRRVVSPELETSVLPSGLKANE